MRRLSNPPHGWRTGPQYPHVWLNTYRRMAALAGCALHVHAIHYEVVTYRASWPVPRLLTDPEYNDLLVQELNGDDPVPPELCMLRDPPLCP